MENLGPVVSRHGLETHGIRNAANVYWNLPPARLYEEAVKRGEAVIAPGGPLVAETGRFTGRSPKDKFTVREASSEADIWWGEVNRPISQGSFERLFDKARAFVEGRDLFVFDGYAGADPAYRLDVRVITQYAWHNLFVRNMFRRETDRDRLRDFEPGFTVIDLPDLTADPEADGTASPTFIVVDLARRTVLIGGTAYAGEMKKAIFGVMNYLLPGRGVLPMHCSANYGAGEDDVALFFGLSGTGKTTLSADPTRTLIGDDEHGWSDRGVFNIEGGCYAKVICLSPEGEPEIYATTRTFGTVLENVVFDPQTRELDLDSDARTENTRSSYPLEQIPTVDADSVAGHPRHIVFLTYDAFGVLPPIARLSTEQALYHFLSGYTAKVAGTERGVKEPQAAFSTCFGAPFMPRHPRVYAEMLGEKIERHGTRVWLINTGCTGGPYGVGSRMKLAYTRRVVHAALNGELDNAPTHTDPVFGLAIPERVGGVPPEILDPRGTWADPAAYDERAAALADMFVDNFRQFADDVRPEITAAGPVPVSP